MSAAEQRRPTPTERLHEVTMAALSRTPAQPESSVTISRNAKGAFQFEVVVRGVSVEDCETVAREVVTRLAQTYPYANGGEA